MQKINPLSCLQTDINTYAAFSCWLIYVCMTFLWGPGVKGLTQVKERETLL